MRRAAAITIGMFIAQTANVTAQSLPTTSPFIGHWTASKSLACDRSNDSLIIIDADSYNPHESNCAFENLNALDNRLTSNLACWTEGERMSFSVAARLIDRNTAIVGDRYADLTDNGTEYYRCVPTEESDQQGGIRTLPYGSRGGEQVEIVDTANIGTAQARIVTAVTTRTTAGHCRDFLGDVSTECSDRIAADLGSNGIRDEVFANCETGAFSDLFNNRYRYRFEGRNTGTQSSAEFAIRDVDTGRILDGGTASNYPVLIYIFHQLCPTPVQNVDESNYLSKFRTEARQALLQGSEIVRDGGFPREFLDASIVMSMLPSNLDPMEWITVAEWLALIERNGSLQNWQALSGPDGSGIYGIKIRRQNVRSFDVVFDLDFGDAFIAEVDGVSGDDFLARATVMNLANFDHLAYRMELPY